jgi:hypothetical protein
MTATTSTEDSVSTTRFVTSPDGTRIAYEVSGTGPALVLVDGAHAPNDPDLPERLRSLVEHGRRGDAVKVFLRTVGAPAPMVAIMRLTPVWKKLTGVAHTLPYATGTH